MVFRQLQVSTLVFSFTVLYYKKKLSEKWVLLRFEQKLLQNKKTPAIVGNYWSANTIFPPVVNYDAKHTG